MLLPTNLFLDMGIMVNGTATNPHFLLDSIEYVMGENMRDTTSANCIIPSEDQIYIREFALYNWLHSKNTIYTWELLNHIMYKLNTYRVKLAESLINSGDSNIEVCGRLFTCNEIAGLYLKKFECINFSKAEDDHLCSLLKNIIL